MASAVIHLVIANELNKELKKDKNKFLIGSIAPDISKTIGNTREKSHFITDDSDLPNVDLFLSKYKKYLDDDFVLGYYTHLFVDYLWFKYFLTEIEDKDMITKLDGTVVKCDHDTYKKYVYEDYTNLNIRLIEEYNLDLDVFYNEIPQIPNIIEEIPMDKLNILIDKMGVIIENSKKEKAFLFNLDNVDTFIKTSIELLKSELDELF